MNFVFLSTLSLPKILYNYTKNTKKIQKIIQKNI